MPDNLKDIADLCYPALNPKGLNEACQRVFSGGENDLDAFKNTGYPSGSVSDVVGLGGGEVDIHLNISDGGLFSQYTTVHLYATYQDTYGGNQGVSSITSTGPGDRTIRVSGLPSDGTQMTFDVYAYNSYIETPNKPELNKIGNIAGSDNIYPQNVSATDVSDTTDEVEVSWDNPGGNPNDLDIRIRWEKNGSVVQTYNYSGSATSASWSGSDNGDDVRVMVNYVASDGSHYSPGYSNTVTNTNNSYQAPPQNLSFTQGSNCSATFDWDHPTSGAPDHYEYEYNWNSNGWGGGGTTSNTQATVYGTDGDSLGFRVRAVNSSGISSDWVNRYTTYFCGGSCFVKGTKVTVMTEQKNIEELQPGDKILGYSMDNFEDSNDLSKLYSWSQEGDIKPQQVVATIKEIKPVDVDLFVSINNGFLEATPSHSQLRKRDGIWQFAPLDTIQVGDVLKNIEGEEIEVSKKDYIGKDVTVYKMTLEEPYHTFYANGILTHNIKIN